MTLGGRSQAGTGARRAEELACPLTSDCEALSRDDSAHAETKPASKNRVRWLKVTRGVKSLGSPQGKAGSVPVRTSHVKGPVPPPNSSQDPHLPFRRCPPLHKPRQIRIDAGMCALPYPQMS